jgi:Na+/H+ antiporter NhaD/arsenite permease-like protein
VDPTGASALAPWQTLLAWTAFSAGYAVFAAGRLPGTRIGRSSMAVLCAAAMLAGGILSWRQAAAGVDAATIALLTAMMLIAGTLHLTGFFDWVAETVAARLEPAHLLPGVVFASGLLSALLVNDVVCLVMTPLVLDLCRRMRVKPLPYLLALATASNVGSAATLTGNPQNILIGSLSGISYRAFAARLAPVATIGLLADWAVIHWTFLRNGRGPLPADEAPLIPEARGTKPRALHPVWPLTVTLGVFATFLLGWSPPWAAGAGAALLLLLRRPSAREIAADVDWDLLLLFLGLFVILAGAERAGISRVLLGAAERMNLADPAAFTVAATALSNLVSNVPAVMLLKGLIPRSHDPRSAWLLLAMASTMAGNLTLTGSIANIIVAEKARGECRVGFWDYARVGAPVALITLAIGFAWLR